MTLSLCLLTGPVTTTACPPFENYCDPGDGSRSSLPWITLQTLSAGGITTDGHLYIIELSGDRVRRIEIATDNVSTFAGSTPGFSNGIGAAAQFNDPSYLTTDARTCS